MLSGFVMAYIYREAFKSEPVRHYMDFLIKRVARLYPAYFAIGLLYLAKLLAGLTGDQLSDFGPLDIIGNLLMLTGWGLHIYPLIGVAWAASAELGSYLVLPLLLIVIFQRGLTVSLLGCAAALAMVCAIAASGRGVSGPLDVVNGNSFLPLLRAIAGFTIGLAIFRYSHHLDRLSMPVQDLLVGGLTLAIIVVGILWAHDLPIYLLFIPFVAMLSRDGRLAQLLYGNRLVYHLGLISYSIYLLHELFVSFAVRTARHLGGTAPIYIASSLVCMGVIWLLAWLSYRYVEMPGRKLVVAALHPDKQAALDHA
jgi:peptidoglycan/LPS O-acetylase OafA/YrhL